jgi:hypothetical protein
MKCFTKSLYKKNCELCGKSAISMYDPENKYVIYCLDCFNSDNWDPLSFGLDYDFSKPFFEQLNNFYKKIPRRALYQE